MQSGFKLSRKGFSSVFLLTGLSFIHMLSFAQKHPGNEPHASHILLPNGWSLSPAGRSIALRDDLPLNMALSHKEDLLAVTNNGDGDQSIQLIDPHSEKILDNVVVKRAWYGLRFSDDDRKLYLSGGNDNCVLVYPVQNKTLGSPDTLILGKRWPSRAISPTGLDIDSKAGRLYVVTREDSSLYVFDLKNKSILKKVDLKYAAFSCLLSPDRSTLYISLWQGDKLAVYNIAQGKIEDEIPTQSHPNELLTTHSGKILFVANANDNSVSVISTQSRKVIETISATLFPTKLIGSTTNGLALSADEKTLYIANADNNCLAVFDVSLPGRSKSKGFIPTGWYPTNVKTIRNKIMVCNGKGFNSFPNKGGMHPASKADTGEAHHNIRSKTDRYYTGSMFIGSLSIIDKPSEKQLALYSNQVYANSLYSGAKEKKAEGENQNPIPRIRGGKSPIKHIFYIIKENRTYDQVFGDIKDGNGDSSLCIFGEKVTPNEHALAKQFVLLDNFYVDAEVSADGHKWSMGAYATDYLEKTWPTNYSRRGEEYAPTLNMEYPKQGYIWDYCKRAGITYRTYGEFGLGNTIIPSLKGHIAPGYKGFDLTVKDIDRVKIFKHDFDSLLAIGQLPALNTIRLANDHTTGQRIGKPTPVAMVADNDLALGQMIEYISKSPVWKESAIFVLEDDAQDGFDHVDAHRSPAFVISPYVKMGSINSSMYSTSGMERTIELILGLPPMSQYDAGALPFFNCFTSKPDFRPYIAKDAEVSLDKLNASINGSSERSAQLDFSKEDAAPDFDLNEIVWKSVKGENSVMPAPRHSAFVKLEKKAKGDDD